MTLPTILKENYVQGTVLKFMVELYPISQQQLLSNCEYCIPCREKKYSRREPCPYGVYSIISQMRFTHARRLTRHSEEVVLF